jgi:hypothetical protein
MKADEMFEKLGYKKNEIMWEEDNKVHYIYYNSNDTEIEFSVDSKVISVSNIIYIQELQAINKKVEELGWNE